jgi:serine/threonine protein kinase/tetratricopeptide (TPR) repeat protein
MQKPQVDGLNVLEVIGHGGCGRVYHAEDKDGTPLVLKIFDDSAIDRALVERVTLKLEAGGWPVGVLPVISGEFAEIPVFRISPLIAELTDDGRVIPSTLQHRHGEHPGPDTWKLVKSLACALAAMHGRASAHGNLKPGNILIDDAGGVLLTDWAVGNMPGVKQFHFTDALLYQPPEQLRDPSGYLGRAGLQWDVFAFGVLAFRILTGIFPRCHEAFNFVAPAPGETQRDGLNADVLKIARNLESQPDVQWPVEAGNPLEEGFRAWIVRCLSIDATDRPSSMEEVLDGFLAVEKEEVEGKTREALMDQRRRSDRRTWRAVFTLGAAVGMAVIFASLWRFSEARLKTEKSSHAAALNTMKISAEAALAAKAEAETMAARAEQSLVYERELWSARLQASRMIGDRLFSWAMEKGHRRLPPLDGRDLRLKRLDRYFEDFLTRTADVPEFEDERARARLQLSEISLAAGDAAGATRRLAEALKAWSSKPMDADLKFRVATNSLLLALLRQSNSDAETQASFATARMAFAAVPRSDVDEDRLDQLLAILDFHEAKLLTAHGQDTKALEQLMRSTQTLNRLAEQRPDSAVLRSELAACYLSSATILEGIGTLGDAREVRSLALAVLTKLLKENPQDVTIRMDLAACYGTMAETAVLSGDIAGAESLSKEALKLLDALLVERPDLAEAVSRKAAQLGLRAGIERDRGLAAEAIKDFDDGIRMLEGIRASSPGDAMASYRLALLWWQKGRMLGMAGNRPEEIALIDKARDLLGTLESAGQTSGPRPEQLQRSVAYLLGDLGHARQLAGRKDDAAHAFSDAVTLWQGLLSSRPQSEEYSESLSWCRQRIQDLK